LRRLGAFVDKISATAVFALGSARYEPPEISITNVRDGLRLFVLRGPDWNR